MNLEKLEVNMACANLLFRGTKNNSGKVTLVQVRNNKVMLSSTNVPFDIFTDAKLCLKSVKKLGEYHDVNILWNKKEHAWQSSNILVTTFKVYEKAVGAAVIAVLK